MVASGMGISVTFETRGTRLRSQYSLKGASSTPPFVVTRVILNGPEPAGFLAKAGQLPAWSYAILPTIRNMVSRHGK